MFYDSIPLSAFTSLDFVLSPEVVTTQLAQHISWSQDHSGKLILPCTSYRVSTPSTLLSYLYGLSPSSVNHIWQPLNKHYKVLSSIIYTSVLALLWATGCYSYRYIQHNSVKRKTTEMICPKAILPSKVTHGYSAHHSYLETWRQLSCLRCR